MSLINEDILLISPMVVLMKILQTLTHSDQEINKPIKGDFVLDLWAKLNKDNERLGGHYMGWLYGKKVLKNIQKF
jgi:hypothetical protein